MMAGIHRTLPALGAALVGLSLAATAEGGEVDPDSTERGRIALTTTSFLKPSWKAETYRDVAKVWGEPSPDPEREPEAYAAAFNRRYGLSPAPYPNDGLPLGLRRGTKPDGTRAGIVVDCMACHGGSIGGTSYVGLGNSQLDIDLLFHDMAKVEKRFFPSLPFVVNSSRGTVNAGMFSVFLLSLRNADLSRRFIPLQTGANIPELDTPPWWILAKKATMYYDGRTDADSVRTNMQFVLGEKSLEQLKQLEPTFRDIQSYLKSIQAPRYPFPVDAARAERGRATFVENCAKCHGTYGPKAEYPSRVVELKEIGTDPARAVGISDRFVAHYNATWFGDESQVDPVMVGYQAPPLDGIWASAPYLHNGSIPTLAALLRSADRPSRFYRPPSTDFAHYDQAAVGWKHEVPAASGDPAGPVERRHALFDSSRFGLGNGGHTYGDRLTDAARADLIEYLKTL